MISIGKHIECESDRLKVMGSGNEKQFNLFSCIGRYYSINVELNINIKYCACSSAIYLIISKKKELKYNGHLRITVTSYYATIINIY